MIRVAMSDENAVDAFRSFKAGAAKPGRQVTREELVVTAVHQNNLAIRRFDDIAVALLNIDEIALRT